MEMGDSRNSHMMLMVFATGGIQGCKCHLMAMVVPGKTVRQGLCSPGAGNS